MNNFNALNQYIASMNQAVNTVMKSNLDLSTRIKALESSDRESVVATPSSTSNVDVDKKVELAVTKVKTELVNSIESLIASLDIDKKIEEAISKLRQEINQAVNVDLSVPTETVEVDAIVDEPVVAEDIVPTGDDMVMGMKEEKKKKSTKKR